MSKLSYEQAAAAVRAEIRKYYDGAFNDSDDLSADLKILSDDLNSFTQIGRASQVC